jgi:hypothetical protein
MGRREKPTAQQALELARAGVCITEIGRRTGYTVAGLRFLFTRHGVKAEPPTKQARNEAAQRPSMGPRLCECCGERDISDRPAKARYCLPCRNSGLVIHMQQRAHNYVAALVKAGLLKKISDCVCVDCGAQAEEYDHRDYFKPADIEPVCRDCNAARGAGRNRFPWRAEA